MKAFRFTLACLFCLFFLFEGVFAQSCYVRLTDDASGYTPTTNQIAELEQAASELCAAFDSAGFGGQFKVYDFGFYLHQEVTEGGYPEPFAKKMEEVSALSPYYLLFGRQTDQYGINTKFWIDVVIPDTGNFQCITAESRNALSNLILINTESAYAKLQNSYSGYAQSEIVGIQRLVAYVKSSIDCCYQRGSTGDCTMCANSDEIEAQLNTLGFTSIPISNIKDKLGNSGTSDIVDYAKLTFTTEDLNIDIASAAFLPVSILVDSGINVRVYITSDEQFCGLTWDTITNEVYSGNYDLVVWYHIRVTDSVSGEGHLYLNMLFSPSIGAARQNDPESVICGPVCWVLKGLGEAAVSAFMQASAIWLVEDDITFSEALGKIDGVDVFLDGLWGIIPGKSKAMKFIRPAVIALAEVIKKSGNENYSLEQAGIDFAKAFIAAAAIEFIYDYAKNYRAEDIVKGLVTKIGFKYSWVKKIPGFDLSYAKFCKKIGYGLKNTPKVLRAKVNGKYIGLTAQRKMVGWDSKKIAIIGRSQDDRVNPFKNALQKELGGDYHIITISDLPGWDGNATDAFQVNQQWIRDLKEQGYTFYDMGYDPNFSNKGDDSPFYNMEIDEVFDGLPPPWKPIELKIP